MHFRKQHIWQPSARLHDNTTKSKFQRSIVRRCPPSGIFDTFTSLLVTDPFLDGMGSRGIGFVRGLGLLLLRSCCCRICFSPGDTPPLLSSTLPLDDSESNETAPTILRVVSSTASLKSNCSIESTTPKIVWLVFAEKMFFR
mmetsp:Transcript_10178/g.17870  ORF Transcript_10178/g.17870 Transcript_10178/m.17870 type:complete len:142 (-) Transcript_10178:1136-1561(-)